MFQAIMMAPQTDDIEAADSISAPIALQAQVSHTKAGRNQPLNSGQQGFLQFKQAGHHADYDATFRVGQGE